MISTFWDKLDPGFLAPIWLVVGFLAVVAIALLGMGAVRRRKQAVQLFAGSHLAAALTASVSPVKRLFKTILLAAAVGLLFTAMARPHLFFDWQEEKRSGLDILLAVDCSKSMLTEDVKPNRIERAKLAISDFADHVPDNRLGLIAFAGDAFLQCPMTLDHDAFQTAVRELDTDTIPRPGTDIATAIDQAVDALRSQPNNMKFLILVTDGEDLEGRALNAARNAAQNGVKIYTIGVGTESGDRIPEKDDSGAVVYHRDVSGQEVVSKLDESMLRQIAELTGGAYLALGQRGEGLDEIYSRYIAPLPKQNLEERRERIPIERFEWPLALAILFLMWEFMIRERAKTPIIAPVTSGPTHRPMRRKTRSTAAATSLVALSLHLGLGYGFVRAAETENAERAYKSGQYDQALQDYEKAAEMQPARSELKYNSGAAAYKAGDYSEAEEEFRRSLETPDLGLQEKSYYNLGNAQLEHGKSIQKADSKKTIGLWEQALHSYDSALKLKTTPDAKHNYDYVKALLEQLKQQQKQKDGQDKKDNKDQSDQGSSQSQSDGQQGQSDPNNPQNGGQNSSQPQPQPGDKADQKSAPDKGKDGQQTPSAAAKNAPLKTYSGTRSQDLQDPGIKSKQDAENLLDSLKDDEHRITARTLNGDNQPPPTPSGKDW